MPLLNQSTACKRSTKQPCSPSRPRRSRTRPRTTGFNVKDDGRWAPQVCRGWKGCCCCCSRLRPHSSAKADARGFQAAAPAAADGAAATGASVWGGSAGFACCCTAAAAGGAWALPATCWAGAAGCDGAGEPAAAALCCGSNCMPLLPFNCCCAACWLWMGARRAVLQQ